MHSNELDRAVVRKTTLVLGAVATFETAFIIVYPREWLSAAFRNAADVRAAPWSICALVVLGYSIYSIRGLPTIGRFLWRVSAFKILAPVIAIPSSILEEVFFRSSLMNVLAARHQSVAVQIAASALAFGAAHAGWGFRGGWRAVRGALQATTLLGAALGVLYVAAGRIVFPCVVAHFAINMILEPWLMYAYVLRAQRRATA